jgi:hypothetical protein
MATQLAVQNSAISITEGRRSVQQMVAQREAIVEAMQRVMKPDIDYGKVPGTDKPSLWKPGSEKILSMFNLAATPTVEDLSTPDTIRYRVHVSVHHIPTGNVLGVGVGEASSAETKYQWRKVVCAAEWDATPEDRRRICWKNGSNETFYTVNQVRTNMEDVANTILKMAKKRGQIDVVLTVTAASDVFSQDVEDLVDAGIDFNQETGPETKPAPQRSEDLSRKADAPKPQSNGPIVTAEQAKRWWAIAIGTHKDHKILVDYLRSIMGVLNKDFIPQARYDEAIKWAEGKG